MTIYHFQPYRGRASHRFTCPSCMKPNRVRTFTTEHTVNPYNTNSDGSVKDARQVSREAQEAPLAQVREFKREPLCASCEADLSWPDQMALQDRRRALSLEPSHGQ